MRIEIERLLLELRGHGFEDQAEPGVELAVRQMAAMLGVAPKLLWRLVHERQDSSMLSSFRLTRVNYAW